MAATTKKTPTSETSKVITTVKPSKTQTNSLETRYQHLINFFRKNKTFSVITANFLVLLLLVSGLTWLDGLNKGKQPDTAQATSTSPNLPSIPSIPGNPNPNPTPVNPTLPGNPTPPGNPLPNPTPVNPNLPTLPDTQLPTNPNTPSLPLIPENPNPNPAPVNPSLPTLPGTQLPINPTPNPLPNPNPTPVNPTLPGNPTPPGNPLPNPNPAPVNPSLPTLPGTQLPTNPTPNPLPNPNPTPNTRIDLSNAIYILPNKINYNFAKNNSQRFGREDLIMKLSGDDRFTQNSLSAVCRFRIKAFGFEDNDTRAGYTITSDKLFQDQSDPRGQLNSVTGTFDLPYDSVKGCSVKLPRNKQNQNKWSIQYIVERSDGQIFAGDDSYFQLFGPVGAVRFIAN